MVQALEGEVSWIELEQRGWTRLPRLEPAAVARLADVANDLERELVLRGARVEAGFYELWGYPDRSLQKATQPLLAAVLAPFLERCAPDHRPVLFNLWVKRRQAARSAIHFHQDFAFVDERAGRVGLQAWIPLVDVSADNGALILVDRTHMLATPLRALDHKHALVGHSLTALPPGGQQLRLAAGEGVLFTNRTVHGSPPNRSDAPRFAVGVLLVPRDLPISCWYSRRPGRVELWSMTDEQFSDHQPGGVPPGATFVDAIERTSAADAPSSRLQLSDGAWLCYRTLAEARDKVVVTDAKGRFLLLDANELDAIARGAADPTEPRRHRLAELGFLRGVAAPTRVDDGVEPPRGVVPVDLSSMTSDSCDALIDSGDAITLLFDAVPDVHEANRALTGAPPYDVVARWIGEIHERFAARGIGPEIAYVNVVSPVTRASLRAGPRAVVDAARAAGVTYIELQALRVGDDAAAGLLALVCSPEEYLDFYRAAIRRVLEINEEGELLVEKRLALHLEALVELASDRRPPPVVAPGNAACGACAYERCCGTSLVQSHSVAGDVVSKAWGSAFCRTSMGTLDTIFGMFASPEGAKLRRVFKRWMSARDRVAGRR